MERLSIKSFITEHLTTLLQVLGFLCIIIVLIHMVREHFKRKADMKVLVEGPIYLVDDMEVRITPEKIMKSIDGTEYTLGFWVYNRNPPENANWKNDYNKLKGVINHKQSPTVLFNPRDSELYIQLGYFDKDEISEYERVRLPIVKQRWQHIVITTKDKLIDLYVDGVLEKSTKLPYEPHFSRKNMFIGEKGNQSLLTIANVSWDKNWHDSNQVMSFHKKQRKEHNVIREPDTYVEQLDKRFS
jgi:hypothetical protein